VPRTVRRAQNRAHTGALSCTNRLFVTFMHYNDTGGRRRDFLRNSYHFLVSWRSIADLCLQNLGDGSPREGEENRDCGVTVGMRLYPPPHHDLTHSRLPQGARDPRYHLQHETLNYDTSNIPLKDKHLWS